MLKLGIIGAENSHSHAVAKLCNLDKAVRMRVPVIWGETRAFAKASAEKGAIPNIVKDWREMLGEVDGVMIDHRHPAPHFEPAKFFLEHKVPCFVDKPFTYRLREAKALLDLANRKRTGICTFSAIPIQAAFQAFKKKVISSGPVRAVNSSGPADIKSKWGGIFFYGIHQVDAIIELLGTDVKGVFVHKNLPNAVATMMYRDGTVATINCIKQGGGGFHWTVCTDKGILAQADKRDVNPYRASVKLIEKLIKTNKNIFPRERMLAPVAVLEAMDRSLKTGKPVAVGRL